LFLDIETVPQHNSYNAMSKQWKQLWDKKAGYLVREEQTPESIYSRAGIYAEFGKIICISVGYLVIKRNQKQLRVKSFYGDDEKDVLVRFSKLLKGNFKTDDHYLCAHNGKEFDFPYLCRRMLVNGLKLPRMLDISGKKPWEVRHLDTMHLWKFGDYKNYISLETLAAIFKIESPKSDLDGSMIYDVYYREQDLVRIVKYCQQDVVTLARLYLKMTSQSIVDQIEIHYADK